MRTLDQEPKASGPVSLVGRDARNGRSFAVPDSFVPALGFASLTPLYDRALAIATREPIWRNALVEIIAPTAGETILDVGCGTGSQAILLKRMAPGARIVGIDPDPAVLEIAARKARAAGVQLELHRGYARDAATVLGANSADKCISSLVFHQVPMPEKQAGLAAMFAAVRAGGQVCIADYGRQIGWHRNMLFSVIGLLDRFSNTRPNAEGVLERLLSELAKSPISAERQVETITGAISIFCCRVPEEQIVQS